MNIYIGIGILLYLISVIVLGLQLNKLSKKFIREITNKDYMIRILEREFHELKDDKDRLQMHLDNLDDLLRLESEEE